MIVRASYRQTYRYFIATFRSESRESNEFHTYFVDLKSSTEDLLHEMNWFVIVSYHATLFSIVCLLNKQENDAFHVFLGTVCLTVHVIMEP